MSDELRRTIERALTFFRANPEALEEAGRMLMGNELQLGEAEALTAWNDLLDFERTGWCESVLERLETKLTMSDQDLETEHEWNVEPSDDEPWKG